MGILNDQDREKVKRHIPKAANKIIDATVARLYIAYPDHLAWQYTGLVGAIALVDDLVGHTFFLKMVDILGNQGVVWDQELYVNFEYNQDRKFFHTFEIEDCLVGLLFEDTKDAAHFYKKVCTRTKHALKATANNKNAVALRLRAAPAAPSVGTRGERVDAATGERQRFARGVLYYDDVPPPEWRLLYSELAAAGISEDMIADNRQFIKDYIAQQGGPLVGLEPPIPRRHAQPSPPVSASGSTKKKAPPPPPPGAPSGPASDSSSPAPASPAQHRLPPQHLAAPTPTHSAAAPPPPPVAAPASSGLDPLALASPEPTPQRTPSSRFRVPPPLSTAPTVSGARDRPLPDLPQLPQSPAGHPSLPARGPAPPPRGNAPPAPPPRNASGPPPPPPRARNATGQAAPPPPPPRARGAVPPPPPRATQAAPVQPQPTAPQTPVQPQPTAPQAHQMPPPPPARNVPPPPAQAPQQAAVPPPPQQTGGVPPPPPPMPPSMQAPPAGGSAPPPPPPLPPAGAGGPPPPPPPMPAIGGDSGPAPPLPQVDGGRDALLALIRGAGGIGALKKTDKSQLERPNVLLAEARGEPVAPPPSSGPGGGGGGLADALAAALSQRKNKVAQSDDEDDDEW